MLHIFVCAWATDKLLDTLVFLKCSSQTWLFIAVIVLWNTALRYACYYCLQFILYSQLSVTKGVDPGGWRGPDPLKMCRRGQNMPRPPKILHSFTQNRCWTTLQAPQHAGWKTCVKNGRHDQFFEASETVWWLGPTNPDPLVLRQIGYALLSVTFVLQLASRLVSSPP